MNATHLLAHFDRLAEAPNAVPRLRRFILDLAVRGKLVPQEAGEEPAGELLRRIQTEKSRLVQQRLVQAEKPLQPITEVEKRLALPKGWAWVRLASLAHLVTSGSRDWAKFYSDEGPIFVRMGNLSRDSYRLRMSNVQRVKPPNDGEGKRTRLEGGDILISITGEVGLLGLIPSDFGEAYINQHTCMVRPSRQLSSRYLPELFRSSFAQDQFNAPQRGLKNSFRLTDVTEFVVPLPPLAEQHRIVAKVDELMALCDQLEAAQQERERRRDRLAAASLQRLNQPVADTTPEAQREHARFHLNHLPRITTRPEHIKALREVVLDAAFQGTLTTQDLSDGTGRDLMERISQQSLTAGSEKKASKKVVTVITLDAEPAFPTPSTWGWASLQMLCEQIGDIDHKMPRAVDVGVPFLSARDLKDGGVLDFSNPKFISEEDFARLSRKVLPRRNDIIYSRIGARLGKARLVEVDTRFLISYSCCLIRPKHEFIDKRYLQIFLDSHLALQQAHSGVQSIGVPDLGLGEIKAYRIPLPPLAEQHRIVAKVDALMALCDQLEAQLTTTQTDSRRLLEAVLDDALMPA